MNLCSGTLWKTYLKNNFFIYEEYLLKDAVFIINFDELYLFIILLEMHHYFLLNDFNGFGDNE